MAPSNRLNTYSTLRFADFGSYAPKVVELHGLRTLGQRSGAQVWVVNLCYQSSDGGLFYPSSEDGGLVYIRARIWVVAEAAEAAKAAEVLLPLGLLHKDNLLHGSAVGGGGSWGDGAPLVIPQPLAHIPMRGAALQSHYTLFTHSLSFQRVLPHSHAHSNAR